LAGFYGRKGKSYLPVQTTSWWLCGHEQRKSQDELGALAAAINKVQSELRRMIFSISENSQNVASASEEFSAVSQQIS
jgi:methyl-accepting chemotaxis protein